jgi:hypothetical protein
LKGALINRPAIPRSSVTARQRKRFATISWIAEQAALNIKKRNAILMAKPTMVVIIGYSPRDDEANKRGLESRSLYAKIDRRA